ncbi:hypothetical protein [Streptomyces sp. HPF1205]|uniref:hypothetical protein n=1 Tax=Streptomyces sp. HPF1205 TaxID=2873262 RepID=UPI0035AB6FFA
MSTRIDYFDDPRAPKANSVVPSANVIVTHAERILMIRRSDNGNWADRRAVRRAGGPAAG